MLRSHFRSRGFSQIHRSRKKPFSIALPDSRLLLLAHATVINKIPGKTNDRHEEIQTVSSFPQNGFRLTPTLALLVPILAGLALAAIFVVTRQDPAADQPAELVRSVAVIDAPEVRWRPRATGYGEARPARTWRAVAQVSGEVTERHGDLETGALLPAGTTLFQIERTDYELAVEQAEASISARKAQLEDLETRERNLRQSLAIEQDRLEVARREFRRQQDLLEKGSVSRSVLDRERRNYLQQQQAVQEIENTIAQLPAERHRIEAELAREQARLKQAQRDLPRTRIKAPFDLRVSSVASETGQFVRVGETLMEGDGIDATEVEAEVPIQQFRAILDPLVSPETDSPAKLDELLPRMGLTAEVRLRGTGDQTAAARWQASVDRISNAIDARTRTVGVVARVEAPYAKARPPEKPPLVKGMYVEVGFCAPPREPAVVLPRASLHEGRVYVANEEGRLAVREPSVQFRHGDFIVVSEGIRAGDSVLVSDPVPAIAGMKLSTKQDSTLRAKLIDAATGAQDCP